MKKGILVVSFGTSHLDTLEKTIAVIEKEVAEKFPEAGVYRAFTSGMIIRKLGRTEGLHIDTVTEALRRMSEDGIEDVIVQPTHIINGIEKCLPVGSSVIGDCPIIIHVIDPVSWNAIDVRRFGFSVVISRIGEIQKDVIGASVYEICPSLREPATGIRFRIRYGIVFSNRSGTGYAEQCHKQQILYMNTEPHSILFQIHTYCLAA